VAGRRPNFMREIPIRLKLEKMDTRVLPDLTASADVTLDSEQKATLAPLSSIFQDAPAAKPFVFVRSASGWQKREVELGLKNNVSAAVHSGLASGDVVALDMPIEPRASASVPPL
jgi:HlyD family secretion protein